MKETKNFIFKQQRFELANHESRWQDSQMRATIQERSFEVTEENETVTVPIKTTSIAEIAAPLPPLTEQQRKDLETVHPNLKAQMPAFLYFASLDPPLQRPTRNPKHQRCLNP